ncbi:hypothetical protein AB9R00_11160, partial [Neisseria gonorrhoeae]
PAVSAAKQNRPDSGRFFFCSGCVNYYIKIIGLPYHNASRQIICNLAASSYCIFFMVMYMVIFG